MFSRGSKPQSNFYPHARVFYFCFNFNWLNWEDVSTNKDEIMLTARKMIMEKNEIILHRNIE